MHVVVGGLEELGRRSMARGLECLVPITGGLAGFLRVMAGGPYLKPLRTPKPAGPHPHVPEVV